MERSDIRRYAANIRGEVDGAFLYRRLAELESAPRVVDLYRRLADVEERHAGFWEGKLRAGGAPVPARRVSWRARVLARAGRRLGSGVILSVVISGERQS